MLFVPVGMFGINVLESKEFMLVISINVVDVVVVAGGTAALAVVALAVVVATTE